jgi:hypothetical protein
MKHSYGIIDRRKILTYKPQLFLESDDLLVFPGKDFNKWHSDIKEYIDGLYQINSRNLQRGESINLRELNLAYGVLCNINNELENLFNPKRSQDYTYHYVSTLDEEYSKKQWYYGDRWRRIDRRVIPITPMLKYVNLMEILDQATMEFIKASKRRMKKQKKLSEINIK